MTNASKPPGPLEHAPHCPGPEYEWQQQIWPGLATRGRCVHCGAVQIDRTGQDPRTMIRGDQPRRARARGAAA